MPGMVTLFLPNGKTFSFQNADVAVDTESELFIEYASASDGKRKVVRVRKEAIVAHSKEAE